MHHNISRGTLLQIQLIEEKYGRSVLGSIGIHGIVALLILFGGYLLPSTTIHIGSGPGGGFGGDVATVGVVEELSGGAGMVKPSIVPRPPALVDKPRQDTRKAIPLPGTIEPKRKRISREDAAKAAKAAAETNLIPTPAESGSGGAAGRSGGGGGGIGGGIGISIGEGSGGFGESWYARTVEARISENWTRPAPGVRVEIIYSFYIAANGTIYGIEQEKSSGNPQMDLTALSAIRASNPLSAPPREFRGRLKFVAHFVHPPDQ
jgi:TonB family protein